MIRRRRPVREIAFSFDSFLDVVANVVGIIIRLILVVWVGARSYSSLQHLVPQKPVQTAASVPAQEIHDPLQQELSRHEHELAEARARLLDQLRQVQRVRAEQLQIKEQVAGLQARFQRVEQESRGLDRSLWGRESSSKKTALSLAELSLRRQKLLEEIRALEKLPPIKQVIRYRTPVSQPLNAEEFLFECQNSRVTFIEIGTMLADVRKKIEEKEQELKTQWQVSDETASAGAFRLRYMIERQRDVLESVVAGGAPDPNASFHYGLSQWVLEPVTLSRGETLDAALAAGSEFRQVVDGLDAHQAAVTFWVYPDSFALYRRLRDYLYERDIVVAGRPLPDGVPIMSSRRGSVSRGQ